MWHDARWRRWCYSLRNDVALYSTLQHSATHCNTLQHTATFCNQPCDMTLEWKRCYSVQHTVAHCNTLQHTATHCTYTATHCNTLYDITLELKGRYYVSSMRYSVVQHTATRCNTLQHTATHYMTWRSNKAGGVIYLSCAIACCVVLQQCCRV